MTRPLGKPPTPSAASIDRHPLGITLTGTRTSRLPSRIIAPLPWSFSICDIAAASNFSFSSVIVTPRWRKLGTWACGADGRGSAPGKRIARDWGRNEVWSLPIGSLYSYTHLPVGLKLPETTLPLATVLRVV